MIAHQFWRPGVLDLTIQTISYCNTGCLHCSLPNEIKAQKNILDTEWMKNYFGDILNILKKNKITEIELTVVGGEFFMMPKASQSYFVLEFPEFLKKWSLQNAIKINYTLISNFLIKPSNLTILEDLVEKKHQFLSFDVYTSYELGTERFIKDNLKEWWMTNVEHYKEKLDLGVLVTLTRQTCEDIENVFEFVSQKFKKIAFQPMDLKGESRNNAQLFPNRELLLKTVSFLLEKQKEQLIKKEIKIFTNFHEQKFEYQLALDNFYKLSGAYNLEINEIENYINVKKIQNNDMTAIENYIQSNFRKQTIDRIKTFSKAKMCHDCDLLTKCNFGVEKMFNVFYDTKDHQYCHAFKELF